MYDYAFFRRPERSSSGFAMTCKATGSPPGCYGLLIGSDPLSGSWTSSPPAWRNVCTCSSRRRRRSSMRSKRSLTSLLKSSSELSESLSKILCAKLPPASPEAAPASPEAAPASPEVPPPWSVKRFAKPSIAPTSKVPPLRPVLLTSLRSGRPCTRSRTRPRTRSSARPWEPLRLPLLPTRVSFDLVDGWRDRPSCTRWGLEVIPTYRVNTLELPPTGENTQLSVGSRGYPDGRGRL